MPVVRMALRHLPALAELEALCFSKPWSQNALEEELQNPLAVFFVSEEDGQAAGYAGMHDIAGEGYIANVAVFPDRRGRGVASGLMEALVAYALARRLSLLTLEVRESNEAAIRLYTRFGFALEGRRRRYYQSPTEDALIYTRRFVYGKEPIV